MRDWAGPFLTDIDDRVRIKGSRDPLGVQPIWTALGRHAIGNLTTVTTSVRDFTTLILGYYFARRVADELGPGSELPAFLRWEQLAAYCRAYINEDVSFRGTERVQANLRAGTRVTLSDSQRSQILSDQRSYGLWGLYSVSSASSGLIVQDPPGLTPDAMQFVERRYLPQLTSAGFRAGDQIVELLTRDEYSLDLEKRDAALCACVARLLRRKFDQPERDFYTFHLLHGGPSDSTEGRQAVLARILARLLRRSAFALTPAFVAALVKEARSALSDGLAFRLERIRVCESVIAPASVTFSYLQGCDGKSVDEIAGRLRKSVGSSFSTIDVEAVETLRSELTAIRDDSADRWLQYARASSQGDYSLALRILIQQNGATMELRAGAPWIEEHRGAIKVRFRAELPYLLTRDDLPGLWRFSYFLSPLQVLTQELGGANA